MTEYDILGFNPETFTTKDVFLYYDRPLLFSCVDKLNHIYIAMHVEESDTEEKWLYLPVSYSRYQKAVSGLYDIKHLFTHSELDFVYIVEIPFNQNQIMKQIISCDELPEIFLPPENTFLLPRKNQEEEKYFEGDPEKLSNSVRMILDYGPYYSEGKAPTNVIGNILLTFQDLTNEVGYELSKVSIPLLITAFNPGSFVIDLQAEDTIDLFSDSISAEAFQKIFSLLDLHFVNEVFDEQWFTHSVRKQFIKFLRNFNDKIHNVTLDWKSPTPHYGKKIRLDKNKIGAFLVDLTSIEAKETRKTISVIGKLRGINLDTNYFSIVTSSDNKYTGKMSNEALNSSIIQRARLDQLYYADIVEIEYVDSESVEEKPKYILEKLELYME